MSGGRFSLGRTATVEPAPAKLNLFLHVIGRRDDGYHLLDSLVVFARIGDELTAEPSASLSLDLTGPFAGLLGDAADNLVIRAARLLAAEAGIAPGAALRLDKRLPVASGIGGGSADAAATLRALNWLWDVRLPQARLERLAARLGADVPVCLVARPTRMGGIGERLEPAPVVPDCGIVLVNPGVPIATADVFRARDGAFSERAALPAGWASAAAMAGDLAGLRNDLQAPAIRLQPAIGAVLAALEALPGCLLARMSGSGATCFGVFSSATTAEVAAAGLRAPGWWVWGGPLWPGVAEPVAPT